MGAMHATRAFAFDGERWQVRFCAFADAQAQLRLFTLEAGGVFRLGGPSTVVPDAFEGIFPALYRRLCAESDAGIALFASQGGTLALGEPRDLVSESCGFVPALMQAMGEYDLVALREDQLFLGDRSGDLTRSRPQCLTPFPLRRVA